MYALDCEYMSGVGFLWVSRFPIVFLVQRAILGSVCPKMFVMYEVSLSIYVKLAHFFRRLRVFWFCWFKDVGFVGFDEEGIVL